MGGSKHFMTVVDANTGWLSVFFLEGKTAAETLMFFREWVAWAERQSGYTVKTVTTDNGGEFVNGVWEEFTKDRGIVHRTTSPYTPAQNGRAERQNRVLKDGELALRTARNITSSPQHVFPTRLRMNSCLAPSHG